MSDLPESANVVVIGVRHRRELGGRPPGRARLARHRADRQGPAAQPGRLDRPRLELHLPGRPQPGDGDAHARQPAPVQAMGVNVTCGGIEIARKPRAAGGVPPAHDLGQGLGHRRRAGHARTRSRELVPFINDRHRPRRLLHAERLGRRLAAGGHASSASGRRRSARCRRSPASRCSASRSSDGARHARSSPTRAASRPSTWSSPAACGARASPRWPARTIPLTPAVHQMIDVGPIPDPRGDRQRDRLPDRPRHGHVHVRAADRRLDGGRLLRPPADLPLTPTTSRRSRSRACRRPSCRSPPTTSTSSSRTRSS